jgi:ATP-binding cassette, subfamily B, bacterial
MTKSRFSAVTPLRRLAPFLRPYWGKMLLAGVSLFVAASMVLGIGSGLRTVIDKGLSAGNPETLDQSLLGLLVVICLLAAATYGRFYCVSWLGERVVADLRRAVYGHLLRLSPGFFETTRTGELLSRLTADITLLQTVVGSSVSTALRNILMLIGGLGLLLVTSPKLTLFVLLVIPLVVVPILTIGRKVRRLSRASQDRVADVSSAADEAIGGIRIVQAYGQENQERTRFAGKVEDSFNAALDRIKTRAFLTMLVIVLAFGAVGVVLWVGGHDVLAGRISAGALSSFVFYAVLVAASAGALSEVMGDLQRASGATERLFEILDTPVAIAAPATPIPMPVPPQGAVQMENITFHYPARPDKAAIEDFSLSIAPGERVALVGPSGAGKTTIFQLLLRFYDPSDGTIRIDGVDSTAADPAELRHRFALVPQDAVIFSGTAADNIRYGCPDATDEDIKAAAFAAHALDFIDQLPNGFDTYLGEKGIRLSGGQRQRIALARAILRNPPILLLDEATSALDAESERLVQNALSKLMQNRTTLVIAHRLATILTCDRIVVMDQGRIVEVGTHASLVQEGGLYARLAALQFGEQAGSAA